MSQNLTATIFKIQPCPWISGISYISKYRWFNFKAEIWKLWPKGFGEHRFRYFFSSRNKGPLRAAVTRPCRLSTPLCHTYSEPSGHELSPGGTQNIPYLFKNLSKSRLKLVIRFLGYFWWFLRSGALIIKQNPNISCLSLAFTFPTRAMSQAMFISCLWTPVSSERAAGQQAAAAATWRNRRTRF